MSAPGRQAAALLREAAASARSQPVTSLLSAVMVAGMCLAVLLTTGRTVAAERAALAQIDAAGTRSIIVRAKPDAGVTAVLLDRLRAVESVEAAVGFGPIVDARNAAVPGGPRVPVRNAYGSIGGVDLAAAESTSRELVGEVALASVAASRELGMRDGTGAVITEDGRSIAVVGGLDVPEFLKFLEPLVAIQSSGPDPPGGADHSGSLAVLVVLARSPAEVAAVETTLRGLLGHVERDQITIESSAQLAAIRAAVRGQLGTYGRATILGILAVSAVLLAVNLLALVTMRRKDFGRRRALGAKRSLIIKLLAVQVAMLAGTGALAGVAASLAWLASTGNPLPAASFVLAVAVAGTLTACLAALPPALYAARRDPLHELRVP